MSSPRIPGGPLDREPHDHRSLTADEQRMLLLDVLAGVELGVWDRSIVQWLSHYDAGTVLTICSLVQRARATAGRDATATAGSIVLSPNDIGVLMLAGDVLDRHGRKELGDGLRRIARDAARPPRRRSPPEPRPPQSST